MRGAGSVIGRILGCRRVADIVERGAIISGIGISRIGRKTGIAGIDLTAESSASAIADAGLSPADIDGIATMGDTPLTEAAARLGIEHRWTGAGMGRWGLLSPVVNAFHAVANGSGTPCPRLPHGQHDGRFGVPGSPRATSTPAASRPTVPGQVRERPMG